MLFTFYVRGNSQERTSVETEIIVMSQRRVCPMKKDSDAT